MRKESRFKKFSLFGLLGMLIALSAFAYMLRQTELATRESSALYGGESENSYLASGYLIAYQNNQPSELCGLVYLEGGIALSAAHCADKGTKFTGGIGQFNVLTFGDIQFSAFSQHPGWDHKKSTYDVARYTLSSLGTQAINQTATIGVPKQNCNYRIVAYGRTEVDGENLELNRPRKGADLCITSIENDIFYLNSSSGGICVGDSGSPIFEKNTNTVVGIVSAIRAKDASNPCYIGNVAIASRLDTKSDYIKAVSNTAPISTPSTIPESINQFTRVIVEENLSLFDQAQKFMIQYAAQLQIAVYMLGIGVVFFIVLILVDRKSVSVGVQI